MLYLVVHVKKNLSNFIFRFYGQLEGSLSETSFVAISSLHGRLLLGNSFFETFQFFLHLPFSSNVSCQSHCFFMYFSCNV